MEDLNIVAVEGRVTRDPELKYTASGTAVVNFTLAVNRTRKDAVTKETIKEASFFDVVAWGKTAEAVSDFVKKGRALRVTGALKQDRWESPEGDKRSKVIVVAERVEFGDTPKPKEGEDQDEKTG